jgi:hypothetical protein
VGPRTVVRDPIFEQLAQRLHPDVRRCDEVLMGVEWAVATNAEWFSLIPGTRLRMVITEPVGDVGALRVFFTIDDAETCTLRYVEQIEGPADDLSGMERIPL